MRSMKRLALVGAVAFCATALAAAGGTAIPKSTSNERPPSYTNAEVVAVDGDRVILTLRRPGWTRVSSIDKTRPVPAPTIAASSSQVASLAWEADRVERVWNAFRGECDFLATNRHEGASEWVVRSLGGLDSRRPVRWLLSRSPAEDVARRTLSPGDIREIRRQHRMDWDGWTRTPPKRLEQ